jgi:hypothetical protein
VNNQLESDLRTFVERSDRLGRTRLVTDVMAAGFNLQTTIQFDVGKGLRAENKEPPEDDLMAFLVVLRPFLTQKDRVSIRRVLKSCRDNLARDSDRERLLDAQRAWEKAAKGGTIGLRLNEKSLSPEAIADLLVNGYYFHDDRAKRAQLSEAIPAFHLLARQEFISFVISTANLVWFVSNMIRRAFDEKAFT